MFNRKMDYSPSNGFAVTFNPLQDFVKEFLHDNKVFKIVGQTIHTYTSTRLAKTNIQLIFLIFIFNEMKNTTEKQDNTRVAKPVEQKFFKRVYQPSQTYLSQDNRTQLQHEEGRKKADEAYNQQLKDKNTAEALNHLIGFNNFLDYAGLGIGAGALLKKGAKYATKQTAEKLANQKIGIVAPQFQQKGKFVSELDWSPKSWFEDAAGRKPFAYTQILEYHIM